MLFPDASGAWIIGRYALSEEIAHGGMATVHIGRLRGSAGFARTVAIKRPHPQYARDPEFVAMFVDEARLAARIHHPNVVSTLDVVAREGELFLVMEYVQGESLSRLVHLARQRRERVPEPMVASIVAGVLHGLHAAHEARGEGGELLGLVHRDVSPQNVLVGTDGVARVLDFGVAKAAGRIHTTRNGELKGKLAYMSPEQLCGEVTRMTDVYAAGVVLWEALAGERLFVGENDGELVTKVLRGCREPPSARRDGISPALDAITLRALSRDPGLRFATAREMARAIEDAVASVSTSTIGDWVAELAADTLLDRARRVESLERQSFASPSADAIVDKAPVVDVAPAGDVDAAPARTAPALPVVEDVVVTQLTTGVTSHRPAAKRVRPARWVPFAAGVAAVAWGGIALYGEHRVVAKPAATGAPPSATANVEERAAPAGSPVDLSAAASASAPGTTPPLKPSVTGTTWTRPPPPRPTNHVKPSRGAPCDPPYYFDTQGVRIFKKECL